MVVVEDGIIGLAGLREAGANPTESEDARFGLLLTVSDDSPIVEGKKMRERVSVQSDCRVTDLEVERWWSHRTWSLMDRMMWSKF